MAKQEISIKLLRPGMYVVGIDVSWLDSPFLRHSFKIQDPKDVKKLKDAGVRIVTIERSKSDVLPEDVDELDEIEATEQNSDRQSGSKDKSASDTPDGDNVVSISKSCPTNETPSTSSPSNSDHDAPLVDQLSVQAEQRTTNNSNGSEENRAASPLEADVGSGPENKTGSETQDNVVDLPSSKSSTQGKDGGKDQSKPSKPSADKSSDDASGQESTPTKSTNVYTFPTSTAPSTLNQELSVARQLHKDAKKLCAQVFDDLNTGKPVDRSCVSELVTHTVDSLARNHQAVISFLHMQRKDETLYEHAFSVFSLSLALAQMLNVREEDREVLAFAALVHDVGWLKLPLQLHAKGKAYTESEFKLVSKHPIFSVRMIEGSEGVTDELKNLVGLHHEHLDGSGYPLGSKAVEKIQNNLLWSILVVADRYDELVHQLLDQPGLVPKVALRQLFKDAQSGRLEARVVHALVTVMGVYPISSALELNSGEKAIVIACNREEPSRPIIRVYYDKRGNLLPKAEDVDLSALGEDHPRMIAKAINWRVPGADPAKVLHLTEMDLR